MENTVAKKYYRFGVLEGNHVEERFGLDYFDRVQQNAKMNTISETRDRYNLHSSMYGVLDQAKATPPVENTELLASTTLTQTYHITPAKETILKTNTQLNETTDKDSSLAFTHDGVKAHMFFGHGIHEDDYKRRELVSTYNLSYGNQIKPSAFIFSKFDSTAVPPVINPQDNVYVKNHMKGIAAIGDTTNLTAKKQPRAYNDFTRTFDSVQAKIPLRK